jgi:hypothetical protein
MKPRIDEVGIILSPEEIQTARAYRDVAWENWLLLDTKEVTLLDLPETNEDDVILSEETAADLGKFVQAATRVYEISYRGISQTHQEFCNGINNLSESTEQYLESLELSMSIEAIKYRHATIFGALIHTTLANSEKLAQGKVTN